MPTDKSCWTCKYLGSWTGGTIIQDFTCTLVSEAWQRGEKEVVAPEGPG